MSALSGSKRRFEESIAGGNLINDEPAKKRARKSTTSPANKKDEDNSSDSSYGVQIVSGPPSSRISSNGSSNFIDLAYSSSDNQDIDVSNVIKNKQKMQLSSSNSDGGVNNNQNKVSNDHYYSIFRKSNRNQLVHPKSKSVSATATLGSQKREQQLKRSLTRSTSPTTHTTFSSKLPSLSFDFYQSSDNGNNIENDTTLPAVEADLNDKENMGSDSKESTENNLQKAKRKESQKIKITTESKKEKGKENEKDKEKEKEKEKAQEKKELEMELESKAESEIEKQTPRKTEATTTTTKEKTSQSTKKSKKDKDLAFVWLRDDLCEVLSHKLVQGEYSFEVKRINPSRKSNKTKRKTRGDRKWLKHDDLNHLVAYKSYCQEHEIDFQLLEDGEPVYEIEEIVNHDYDSGDANHYFRVAWEGYSSSFDTWEHVSNVYDSKAYEQYCVENGIPMRGDSVKSESFEECSSLCDLDHDDGDDSSSDSSSDSDHDNDNASNEKKVKSKRKVKETEVEKNKDTGKAKKNGANKKSCDQSEIDWDYESSDCECKCQGFEREMRNKLRIDVSEYDNMSEEEFQIEFEKEIECGGWIVKCCDKNCAKKRIFICLGNKNRNKNNNDRNTINGNKHKNKIKNKKNKHKNSKNKIKSSDGVTVPNSKSANAGRNQKADHICEKYKKYQNRLWNCLMNVDGQFNTCEADQVELKLCICFSQCTLVLF